MQSILHYAINIIATQKFDLQRFFILVRLSIGKRAALVSIYVMQWIIYYAINFIATQKFDLQR